MKAFMTILMVVAVVFGLVLAPGVALADTCTFTATSGNWDVAGNWDCAHVPTAADRVIIPNGKTCAVNVTNAEADTVTVESTGTLNIQASKVLTLDDDDNVNNTAITGTMNLQGSSSELVLQDNNHTIGGTGKIVGADDTAKITIANGKTLTNDTTIEGKVRITGTGGTFVNRATVHINTSGTLQVSCTNVDDTSAGLWKISGSASAVLDFDQISATLPIMDGDWIIQDGGRLDVDSVGFYTTGTLEWTGGIIDVRGGAVAYFGYIAP